MRAPNKFERAAWCAEVSHAARIVLRKQGIRDLFSAPVSREGMQCLREGARATHEGRLRLGVLLFASAFGADLRRVARSKLYRALPCGRARLTLPHERRSAPGRFSAHAGTL